MPRDNPPLGYETVAFGGERVSAFLLPLCRVTTVNIGPVQTLRWRGFDPSEYAFLPLSSRIAGIQVLSFDDTATPILLDEDAAYGSRSMNRELPFRRLMLFWMVGLSGSRWNASLNFSRAAVKLPRSI